MVSDIVRELFSPAVLRGITLRTAQKYHASVPKCTKVPKILVHQDVVTHGVPLLFLVRTTILMLVDDAAGTKPVRDLDREKLLVSIQHAVGAPTSAVPVIRRIIHAVAGHPGQLFGMNCIFESDHASLQEYARATNLVSSAIDSIFEELLGE